MLATIGGILVTVFGFLVMVVMMAITFVVAMVPQVWTLAVQTFNAIAGMVA